VDDGMAYTPILVALVQSSSLFTFLNHAIS
jgi:hypothetical protein